MALMEFLDKVLVNLVERELKLFPVVFLGYFAFNGSGQTM